MHRCLQSPELRSLILGQLLRLGWLASLVALASCCHELFEPVMALLWRQQRGLRRLVLLLPGSAFADSDRPNSNNSSLLSLSRRVMPPDLKRLRVYAQFVKVLDLDDVQVTPDIIAALAAAFGGEALLPALRRLSWAHADGFGHVLHHLSSPSLHTLHVVLHDDDLESDVQALLSIRRRHSPISNLRLARIPSAEKRELGVAGLSQALHGWTSLRKICLGDGVANSASLSSIASLPNLREASFERLLDDHTFPRSFRALQYLSVGGNSLLPAIHSIKAVESRRIGQLVTSSTAPCHSKEWAALFAAIYEHWDPDTPYRLFISDLPDPCAPSSMPADPLRFSDLRSLIFFNNITAINIDKVGGVALTDEDLWRLARSWPCIQQLHLRGDRTSPPVLRDCTLRGLAPFTRCQHLVALTIEVDATGATLPPQPVADILQRALKTINFGRSPVQSSLVVAAFLTSIFQGLEHVGIQERLGLDGEEAEAEESRRRVWKKVQRALPLFSATRASERRRFDAAEPHKSATLHAKDYLGLE
ncbi:hypothetical protein BD626DRAFT_510830 [Schizophyllum amplum]|uniref:F-box domain-containing protein n=1 Tax=Schizophyllum amplum TaxID=97359 RepID=A0A550C1E4_9AGAR|nr:hypothetical protein BD626DRAFT_510830 [Auriculariopsis ampla]